MICCPSAVNKCPFKRTYYSMFGNECFIFGSFICCSFRIKCLAPYTVPLGPTSRTSIVIKYMGREQTHRQTHRHPCRHINIMTRTGLRAGPCEKSNDPHSLSWLMKVSWTFTKKIRKVWTKKSINDKTPYVIEQQVYASPEHFTPTLLVMLDTFRRSVNKEGGRK